MVVITFERRWIANTAMPLNIDIPANAAMLAV